VSVAVEVLLLYCAGLSCLVRVDILEIELVLFSHP